MIFIILINFNWLCCFFSRFRCSLSMKGFFSVSVLLFFGFISKVLYSFGGLAVLLLYFCSLTTISNALPLLLDFFGASTKIQSHTFWTNSLRWPWILSLVLNLPLESMYIPKAKPCRFRIRIDSDFLWIIWASFLPQLLFFSLKFLTAIWVL